MTAIRYWTNKYLWNSIDWLFPPHCGGCDAFGIRWCENCHAKVELVGKTVCPICGFPQSDTLPCSDCYGTRPYFDRSLAWAVYKEPLRNAIRRLKYKNDMALGEYFSKYLIETYTMSGWNVDLVLPVPLSRAKKIERGYNQADLLAKPLANYLDVPYISDMVVRRKETRSQVGLSKEERRSNVSDAFEVVKDCSKYHSILIVDDVMTTGATINACAKVLKNEGVGSVYGLTVARAGIGVSSNDDSMIIY